MALQHTLRVWEGDYGVPSVDPHSLYCMTMLQMRKIDVKYEYVKVPQWREPPSLFCNNKLVANSSEVEPYICDSLDSNDMYKDFDKVIRNQTAAYNIYFKRNVDPIFYNECWINNINYEHMTKPWFKAVIPFPFAYFYLQSTRRQLTEYYLDLLENSDPQLPDPYAQVAKCLDDLTDRLKGGRKYFFGDLPTSTDATVYSRLAIVINAPFPSGSPLQNLVRSHPELVAFIKRMTETFFPDTPNKTTSKYLKDQHSTNNSNNNDRASTSMLIFTALFASAGMILYAYNIGLIKPRILRS